MASRRKVKTAGPRRSPKKKKATTMGYTRQHGVRTTTRHPGSVWIEQHRATLPDNHWVAASAGGLVAQAPAIDDLMSQIQRKEIDPAEVAIAFITSDAV